MQKILVVDDEPWIQQLVEAMLEPLGVEVHVASDGVQGLELSRLHAYDLIISDVEMPRMDGFQMIDQLRREGCDAAIILFTGKATLQQALDARERYGIAGFISKPIVGRDQFLYQVQTALRTRQLERTRERPAASAPGPPAEPGAAAPEATPAAQFDVFRNSVLQVLAHEVRTPLAIVKGYLPLIADGARGDASAAPEPMRRAIDRLQQIVDRALALLARPTPGPAAAAVVPVRPAALCERVAARLRPLAARREVEIECAPGEALPECRWDAEKIDAVLEELLINAIRATADGGSVRLVARSEGELIEFRVIDRGAGVPPEERERIFEPFVTLADPMKHSSGMLGYRAQGVGLGLTLARATARLHGGTLTLETTGPRGSTFLLTLPRVAPTVVEGDGRA